MVITQNAMPIQLQQINMTLENLALKKKTELDCARKSINLPSCKFA